MVHGRYMMVHAVLRLTKFELVVNMKTAKAPGIRIPNSILVRATKVIE